MRDFGRVLAFLGLLGYVAAQCNPSPCGVNTNCEVSEFMLNLNFM